MQNRSKRDMQPFEYRSVR